MRRMIALFFLVTACGGEAPQGEPLPQVSWATEVAPILAADCSAAGCHASAGNGMEIVGACAPDYLEAVAYVDQAAPESSLLLVKGSNAEGTHTGGAQLDVDEYALVLEWIEAGAPEDCETRR